MNWHDVGQIVIMSIVTATVSYTIAKAVIFEDFRHFLHAEAQVSVMGDFFHELFTCPYCLSHWIALILVAVYQPRIIDSGFGPLDFAMSIFVIVTLSTIIGGYLWRAYKPNDHNVYIDKKEDK